VGPSAFDHAQRRWVARSRTVAMRCFHLAWLHYVHVSIAVFSDDARMAKHDDRCVPYCGETVSARSRLRFPAERFDEFQAA
jgi:hypothetical protein